MFVEEEEVLVDEGAVDFFCCCFVETAEEDVLAFLADRGDCVGVVVIALGILSFLRALLLLFVAGEDEEVAVVVAVRLFLPAAEVMLISLLCERFDND